ncbi:DUF2807 domain-containing protein [Flavobacterium sp. xlx-214]|uniref:head GIN domain-containing protein n=1 Tax=unclassified Flavobacterium TaxID=196869 RepID=UPI0013D80B1C|nr:MULTISPECIES: head GIN domain-containing protein [unclassified Flavobacterium]MBA5792135.1 DUF2807 domain-containing protein [Flavobacterium sp. xlx-221]QMI84381.1 DUF2807 domain-containing protein [Flavobacterium sp. xlx-214]
MKKILVLSGIFMGFQFTAQAQIEKNIGDFTSLKTTNRIKVELIPSTTNKVVLKDSDEKSVNITNKNGRLILKNTVKELVTEGEYSVTVQVYFTNLNEIDAQGGSYIFSTQTISQDKLKMSANLGSTIDINLNTKTVEGSVNTGGKLKLKGTNEESVKLLASTGSHIQANELTTNKNKVTVNSGSTATVTATTYLEAQVIAGGTIKIYGNPKEIKEKTSIGGTIERIQ